MRTTSEVSQHTDARTGPPTWGICVFIFVLFPVFFFPLYIFLFYALEMDLPSEGQSEAKMHAESLRGLAILFNLVFSCAVSMSLTCVATWALCR